MRDVIRDLLPWWERGRSAAVATVVETWNSAPRGPGSAMAVGPEGEVVGSVSGGCVEGAVYDIAREVLATGKPNLQRYGVNTGDAFAVGLTCGGVLDVFVERVDRDSFPELGAVARDIRARRPVAVATVVAHPDPSRVGARLMIRAPGSGHSATTGLAPVVPERSGTLGSAHLDEAVRADALGMLAAGLSESRSYGPEGQRRSEAARVFVSSYAPPPRIIVFGAIDFADALTRIGAFLGYHVTLCDARGVFATAARFPHADDVVVQWPHRYLAAEAEAGRLDGRTAIAVLTHDAKFDVPVLEVALRLPEIGYIGAMGSRRTHEDRLSRLREAGLTPAELARLSSPIGLDLGARSPEETAVSIAAEIIAISRGGRGGRLSELEGPIHRN